MSCGPILLSLSLLVFWFASGWVVLALVEPGMAPLRSFLLAPLVGVASTLLPIFWLSLAGIPVSSFARPLLVAFCVLVVGGWIWRRPAWTRGEVIFLLPVVAAIIVIGFPAFRFGFDWIGNANDDWANYNLSAIRLLNDCYFRQPPIESMRAGQYYPGFMWFLNVAIDARSGSDLLLGWIAGSVGQSPFFVFMPVILALHGVFVLSAAGLAMTALTRRVLLAAVVLLAVAPLNLYAVHQQLIAQVLGLAFMCALGALAFVPLDKLKARGRVISLTVVAASYLLVYPETIPFFGIAFLLFQARHVTSAGLDWSHARILLVPAACSVLLGPYSIGCLFFLLSQLQVSATQGLHDGTSIFPYFLVPNGIAVLFGISRLGEFLIEPCLSISIALGLLLLLITCFGMVVELVRGRPVSYYLLVVCVVASVIIKQHNNFGLLKSAMFSQAFIWFVLVAALARFGTKLSKSAYAFVLLLIVVTDVRSLAIALEDDVGSGSLIARASRSHLLTVLLRDTSADSCDANFVTPNPPLIKLLGARVDCARSFIARADLFSRLISGDRDLLDRNPLHGLFGITAHTRYAATRLWGEPLRLSFPLGDLASRSVFTRRPVMELPKVGDDWSSDSIYSASEGGAELPGSGSARANELVFIGSNVGGHYYFPHDEITSLFQTQRDFFYPGGKLAAVGRYLLFRINSPARSGRLVLNLTTTVFGDGCACLPPVSVAGEQQVLVGVSGHGAARVVSPAFSPRIVDGVAYLLIDIGADARLLETPRTGLMALYGTGVAIDYRKMTAYVRQIRFIDAASADEVRPPSKIDQFPSDLAAPGLEFSGIYEDGWMGDQGFVTLYSETAGMAVVRGLFPAGIGLDSVEVTLTVGSSPPVMKKIKPGPFVIAAPAAAGRARIGIRFSQIGRLPAGDGRPAVARITSVAVDTDRDHAVAPSELSEASAAKVLGPIAEAASGVFSDGWIVSAGDIVVNLKSPAEIILRGMIPGGIGLEGQEIAVNGDVGAPIRKQLAPGEFGLEIPVREGRSRIKLAFSKTAVLPDGDGRNVAALLRSIETDSEPPFSMPRLKRIAREWLAALRDRF